MKPETKQFKELEKHIDEDSSTYTDWQYLEGILEWLSDYGCLNKRGTRFWKYLWNKYVKEKTT
jgi:hypothetical protein